MIQIVQRLIRFLSSRAASITSVAILLQATAGYAASPFELVREARKPNTTASQFLYPKVPSAPAPTLIIFIHGVFGDTIGTWGLEKKASLPEYILKMPEFSKNYDIYAFGFPSETVRVGSFGISEAAKALKTDWDFNQFGTRYQRVVIVAHSMGGLVAFEALSTFSDMRARVPLIVTFATPYDGSQAAILGNRLVGNPALGDMLPRDNNNGFLVSLANRWKELKEKDKSTPLVKCAYETVPILGIGLVVPPTSGSSLCDGSSDAIAEDHIGIVKPTTDRHGSVKTLVNALRLLEKSRPPMGSPKLSVRKLLLEEVNTSQLTIDVRFVADKVHRNLAEHLDNLGHTVVAPPISTSKASENTEFWRVFSLKATAVGTNTSLDLSIRNPDGSIIATTELFGGTAELREIYKVLPEALIYGLDINDVSLVSKRSKKLPTKDVVAYAQFLQARRRLELGDLSGSLKALAKATAVDKRFAMAYWAIGELQTRQGNTSEASRNFERARSIDPDHPKIALSSTATERPAYALMDATRRMKWTSIRPGLMHARAHAASFDIDLYLWSIDPGRFKIAVVEQKSPFGTSVREFLSNEKDLLAVQGGFFDMDDRKRLSPAGALVADGVVRNGTLNRQSGAFVLTNGRYDIVWSKDLAQLSTYSLVLQSGPILVEGPGQIGIRANDFDRLNRSAVCLRRGEVIIASLHGVGGRGLSLYEFASLLTSPEPDGGIGCDKALNLDGGPSTQVAFRNGTAIQHVQGLWNVQNAIVVSYKD